MLLLGFSGVLWRGWCFGLLGFFLFWFGFGVFLWACFGSGDGVLGRAGCMFWWVLAPPLLLLHVVFFINGGKVVFITMVPRCT